jgi:PIN domain nuclease of toxin-antitoxin system
METRAYLDTHVVIWLYDRELEKLTDSAIEIIETRQLYVSEFVRLELKYLQEIDRLTVSPDHILRFLQDEIGMQVCGAPLPSIITEAMEMSWTRDPFDRLITATASYGNDTLLTRDEKILTNYPHAQF